MPCCEGVHGPGAYCDDTRCPCMVHARNCGVDKSIVSAPELNALRNNHEGGEEKPSRLGKVGLERT